MPLRKTTRGRLTASLGMAGLCLLTTSSAWANNDEDCPPGGWFCEETEPPQSADEIAESDVVEEVEVYEARPIRRKTKKVIVIEEAPPPKPKKRRKVRLWGINLRLQGVMMSGDVDGHQAADDAGMGGLGVSLRYRPIPHFAFDAGLDFIGGTDFQGDTRRETALLLSGIYFVNPKNPGAVLRSRRTWLHRCRSGTRPPAHGRRRVSGV